jgi:hypothetical protein
MEESQSLFSNPARSSSILPIKPVDFCHFLAKTVADPKGDFWEKMAAAKELMNRAFGKPPQSIEAHFQEQKRQILEVRWLPPDPNDRSRLIEPEPD